MADVDRNSDFHYDQAHEIGTAREKFPSIKSLHEGYAIILEELDEFWEECKKQYDVRDPEKLYRELIQIAAMAQRTAEDCLLP